MRYDRCSALVGAVGLVAWLVLALPVGAVEYRLRVVSIPESAYASFLRPGESRDGASGPGLDRLEATLDRGEFPSGPVLFDRRVQPVRESLAQAYGGARILPTVKPGGAGPIVFDEMVWAGKPGEHSVWILLPIIRNFQEVYNVALRGTGPLRNFQPYTLPMNNNRVTAMQVPLNFLWAQEERGTIWSNYLAHSLDLSLGIGVVIGVNVNPLFPDQVYLITRHSEQPTTYEAVVGWRERRLDREAPGSSVIIR